MILDRVTGPADLRGMTYEELDELALEAREFLLNTVSRTGGHLSPNLGAVELTLAVHRVFDSPRDIILWDCGHQTYMHKLVTGRRDGFRTLRSHGGLSGFPCRSESCHDWIEHSHASPVLAYAHGWATVVESQIEPRSVVAIVGDGGMTGGMFFEGLNNIGFAGRSVVLVINDNGRSYAPTITRLSVVLEELALSPVYRNATARLAAAIEGRSDVSAELQATATAQATGTSVTPKSLFGVLGWHYIGTVDGHNVGDLERALRAAVQFDGPVVVHAVTVKGKGYEPAETDAEKRLHDVVPFDLRAKQEERRPAGITRPAAAASASGGPGSPAAAVNTTVESPPTFTEVFSRSMVALGHGDARVHAITAAMPGPTGLLPFARAFPDRFLDVGLAEQHATATAAAMAMGGLRPVVAVFSTFLVRAFDQLNLDIGLHHLPVMFCVDRAGITGSDGPSHHGVLDLALCIRVPGMTVFAPSSAEELTTMLTEAVRMEGPCAIRYPKGVAPPAHGAVGSGLAARRVATGDEVCILAVGKMLAAAREAAARLEDDGISTSVWDVRLASPLDHAMITEAARHDLVVTVEDGVRQGGVGTMIADEIASYTEHAVRRPPLILGTPRSWLPQGNQGHILAEVGLNAAGIAHSAYHALGRQGVLN